MTDRLTWSQDDTGTTIEILTLAVDNPSIKVFDGRATKGAKPPFVVCWQLDPEQWGAGLASECWGRADQQWFIGGHGKTQTQARQLAETITTYPWPAGWELVEVGPMQEDTADAPTTWWYPVTLVYRGQ